MGQGKTRNRENMITQDLLQELFEYRNGWLYRKVKSSSAKVGDLAGTKHPRGYWHVRINGRYYLAHRLVFLYFNGHLPMYIDHINGDPLDNRIENLRECTRRQNNSNRKVNGKNNTSSYKGVKYSKPHNKWVAQVGGSENRRYLGLFDSALDAAIAYNSAAKELYGEFARLNIINQ